MARQWCPWIAFGAATVPLVLIGCSNDATSQPAGERSSDPSGAQEYVLLLDDDSVPDQVQGEPGAYALTIRGAETAPLAVLDVPAGFSNFGSFALWPFGTGEVDGDRTEEPFRAVQYWNVHGVFPDPCDRGGRAAPSSGDSVQELAAALAAQQLTATTKPVPVSIDGHEGLYVELTVPRDVEIDECRDGYYLFLGGLARRRSAPGFRPGHDGAHVDPRCGRRTHPARRDHRSRCDRGAGREPEGHGRVEQVRPAPVTGAACASRVMPDVVGMSRRMPTCRSIVTASSVLSLFSRSRFSPTRLHEHGRRRGAARPAEAHVGPGTSRERRAASEITWARTPTA